MADRFHFNPETGRTGKCSAEVQCRFGQSADQHGASREEARANYEQTMEPELFGNTVSKAAGRAMSKREAEAILSRIIPKEHGRFNRWTSYGAEAAALRAELKLQGIDSSGMGSDDLRKNSYYSLSMNEDRLSKGFPTAQQAEADGYHNAKVVSREELDAAAQKRILAAGPKDAELLRELSSGLDREDRGVYPIRPKPLNRYTEAQLDAESAEFESNHGYSVGEMMEMRDVDLQVIEEAERDFRGYVGVKIPSYSETSFSTELARRELQALEEKQRNSFRSSWSGNPFGRY